MTREEAWQNDAVWARFYRDGKTIGDIVKEFGGGVYTYSPWLTAPIVRAAINAADATRTKRESSDQNKTEK